MQKIKSLAAVFLALLILAAIPTHATLSRDRYRGNNFQSGRLPYVRYEHSCLKCGRTTGYWDHYSCPGNGHCNLPQSVFPVLTDK